MKLTIRGETLYLSEWYSVLVDKIRRPLMKHRIIRCDYCDNTGEGCDCGACGLVEGSYGYNWCMNYNGCPLCGRHR